MHLQIPFSMLEFIKKYQNFKFTSFELQHIYQYLWEMNSYNYNTLTDFNAFCNISTKTLNKQFKVVPEWEPYDGTKYTLITTIEHSNLLETNYVSMFDKIRIFIYKPYNKLRTRILMHASRKL